MFNFLDRSYSIKKGYKPRTSPNYFSDDNDTLIYQPEVYKFAYYLAERSGAQYIIDIGAGNGAKLQPFQEKFKIIAIDYGSNLDILRSNIPNAEVIEYDFEQGLPNLTANVIENAVVICSDVIEHIIEPDKLLKRLAEISQQAMFVLISTPDRVKSRGIGDFGQPSNEAHVREWSAEELDTLLTKYNFKNNQTGYTINTDKHQRKSTIISLSGKLAKPDTDKKLKIQAIMTVYNELDIAGQAIHNLLNEGVDVHVIDNWSKDGSYEMVKELSEKDPRVSVERFPENGPDEYYEWGKLLTRVEELAMSDKYDWYIHHDSDEIRESPWQGISLQDAISGIDQHGFSAIDFTVIDFRPTEDGFTKEDSPQDFYQYFEMGKRPGHFLQIKAWKKLPDIRVDLATSGGHEAAFEGRKVYPLKFLLRHYPLRSKDQAEKKVFNNRLPRISPEEKNKGWHHQYNKVNEETKFIWEKDSLMQYHGPHFKAEYFIERLSGIGIIRE